MSSQATVTDLARNVSSLEAANGVSPKRGMVLPFTPLAMSFNNVDYYVDMPAVSICIAFSVCLKNQSPMVSQSKFKNCGP